jgi:hypothetical protein
VTAHLGPFFKLKMIVDISIKYHLSLSNLGAIYSLSTKAVISMSPILSPKYGNFILDKGFVKIYASFSSMEIYQITTSLFHTLS